MFYEKIDFRAWGEDPERHRADVAALAELFAYNAAEGRGSAYVWRELDAVLQARQECCRYVLAVEDFTEDPGELAAARNRKHLLSMYFRAACSALKAKCVFLPSTEIVHRKQIYGVKLRCMDALTQPVIPDAEKLTEAQSRAVWEGLTRHGLISGDFSAFCRAFGPTAHPDGDNAPTPLKWRGKPNELAYFVSRITKVMQGNAESARKGARISARGSDICRTLGAEYTDKIRQTVRRYNSYQKPPKSPLVQVFNRLETQTGNPK